LCSAILGCAIFSLTHRVFVVAVVHRRFLAAIGINILIDLEKKILENGLSEESFRHLPPYQHGQLLLIFASDVFCAG
jgi:hypothetical protein